MSTGAAGACDVAGRTEHGPAAHLRGTDGAAAVLPPLLPERTVRTRRHDRTISQNGTSLTRTWEIGCHMALFVLAHGDRDPRAKKVFVPRGVTVHFYARSGELAATANLLKVLTGAVKGDHDSYRHPRKIRNYCLFPHDAHVVAAAVEVASSPDDVMTVERTTHLCEATPERPCVRRHTCTGLFGAIQTGGIRFDANLHILACRGATASAAKMTMTLPGERKPEFIDHLTATSRRLQELAAVNQADAESYFDGLDDETRALLLGGFDWPRAWSYTREAKRYLNAVGPLGFLRFWLRQPKNEQEWLSADPVLAAAIQEAQNLVRDYPDLGEAAWAAMTQEDHDNLLHCLVLRGTPVSLDAGALSQLAARRNREVLGGLTGQTVSFAQVGPVVAIGVGHDPELVNLLGDPIRRHVLKTGTLQRDHDAFVARYDDPAFDSDSARDHVAEAVRLVGGDRVLWT